MREKAYIFDLDHTLCHPVNRGPYASGADDEVIPSTLILIHSICSLSLLSNNFIQIIILSGRKESEHLNDTLLWCMNNDVRFASIYLNPTDPCTKAEVFKRDKLLELKERYDILGLFDDDPLVAELCKELHIPNFLFSYNY